MQTASDDNRLEQAGQSAAPVAERVSRRKSERAGGAAKTRRPRKKPVAERLAATMLAHPVVAGTLSALLVAGGVVFIFWFTLFSGIEASADFVYSQF